MNVLRLEHDGGTTEIPSDSVLVFIDDTGHEDLTNLEVPFFGFGGCLCPASHYSDFIDNTWKQVEAFFPDSMLPLHAADLRPKEMSQEQLSAISDFFKRGNFGRFARVASNKTLNESKDNIYHIVARATHGAIAKIMCSLSVEIKRVDMFFERSQRTGARMRDYFSRYDFSIGDIKLPVRRWEMTKSKDLISGLCIADFIAHTAGVSVRSRLEGKRSKENERHDFKVVFMPERSYIADFREITRIEDK